jgi:hypothetical protein
MTDLDRLPPDQRAVLSLVLNRGKSYGEVADMLAIPESAVRDRAHAALDALANDAAGAGGSRPQAPTRVGSGDASRATSGAAEEGPADPYSPSASRRSREARAALSTPSSRRGGALLLGAIVVIVVAVVLITSGGGKKSPSNTSTGTSTGASTTASTGKSKVNLNKTITLSPAEPTLKATGKALVLSENGRYAFYIAARGLPPSSGFFYAVWLYNSPSSAKPLGRAPTVSAEGNMEGGGPLPTNAADYGQLIITRETSTHPSHPGPTVMSGPFALH